MIQVIRPPDVIVTDCGLAPAEVIVIVALVGFGVGAVSSSSPLHAIAARSAAAAKRILVCMAAMKGKASAARKPREIARFQGTALPPAVSAYAA